MRKEGMRADRRKRSGGVEERGEKGAGEGMNKGGRSVMRERMMREGRRRGRHEERGAEV